MPTPLNNKSTNAEIRERFDNDVERFSNLDTGQAAVIDAPLMMDLITSAALARGSRPSRILDIGCGAGNQTLKLLKQMPEASLDCHCDLLDLSQPMLERAKSRVTAVCQGAVQTYHADIREVVLPECAYDVIIAGAVLHHLRDDADWEQAFEKLFQLTAPGGAVWISDMVRHENSTIHDLMWSRYAAYLAELGGTEYQKKVFDYIDKEDSPRPVTYQLDLLKRVGFDQTVLLHKNSCFAAFGAMRD